MGISTSPAGGLGLWVFSTHVKQVESGVLGVRTRQLVLALTVPVAAQQGVSLPLSLSLSFAPTVLVPRGVCRDLPLNQG